MAVARNLWGFIERRDHRVMRRMNRWRAPRWVRYWMIAATRCGDGWLWYGLGVMLAIYGGPQKWAAVGAAGLAGFGGIFVCASPDALRVFSYPPCGLAAFFGSDTPGPPRRCGADGIVGLVGSRGLDLISVWAEKEKSFEQANLIANKLNLPISRSRPKSPLALYVDKEKLGLGFSKDRPFRPFFVDFCTPKWKFRRHRGLKTNRLFLTATGA